jgi:hypothetical protein
MVVDGLEKFLAEFIVAFRPLGVEWHANEQVIRKMRSLCCARAFDFAQDRAELIFRRRRAQQALLPVRPQSADKVTFSTSMQTPDDFWIVTAIAERTTTDFKGLDGLLQLIRGLGLFLEVAMDLATFVVPVPGEKIW